MNQDVLKTIASHDRLWHNFVNAFGQRSYVNQGIENIERYLRGEQSR